MAHTQTGSNQFNFKPELSMVIAYADSLIAHYKVLWPRNITCHLWHKEHQYITGAFCNLLFSGLWAQI